MWNPAVVSLVVWSFVLGACEFIMIGILPEVAESLAVPLTQAGMLISGFAFAYAVGTPLFSVWGTRFPRRGFLLALAAAFTAANVVTFFLSDYGALLVLRMAVAVLSGASLSVSTTFAPDITERKYLPSVVAWIFAGFSIAAVFGVPIGTMAAQYISWRWIFACIACIAAGNFLLMARSLPAVGRGRGEVDLKAVAGFLTDRRVLLAMGISMTALAGDYTWYAYVTPILRDVMGMEAAWVSPFLFLFGAMTVVSNLGSGRVAALGGMYILWPILAVEAAVNALLLLTLHVFWLGLATILFLGVFIYIYNSSVQIYFLRISTLFHPGTLLIAGGLLPSSANLGIAVGTAAGGLTADAFGLSWTPLPGVVFSVLAAYFCWLVMKPERERLLRISYRGKGNR